MAVIFVELDRLKCSGCGAPHDSLILVKRHRVLNGKQVIYTEIYSCRQCHKQTGTLRAESDPSNPAQSGR